VPHHNRTIGVGVGSGGLDGIGEQFGSGSGRDRGVAAFGTVDTYDGVEVDGSALAVLGDLGEGDPGVPAERAQWESGPCGDLAA
jgi:hypothetical protein